MEEPLKQVYVPTVATPGGEKTQLGVFSSEQDAWDVMRAFLAKAGATYVVHGNITAWEIDFVGEEGSFVLVSFDRNNCPVCDELTFWIEGDDERASCSFQKLPIASGCAVVPNSAHIVSKKQSSSVSCSARAQS